ncbi:MAG: hypothetical protein J6N70_14235 [Oribacterium sp.]|nr:hypothetical protein [Oribacterium sp.]
MANEKTTPRKKETNEEKLTRLREMQAKAQAKQEIAEKKTAKLNEQIEAVEREIHNKEVAKLDTVCKSLNITYEDICDLFNKLNMPFDEIKKILMEYSEKSDTKAEKAS